MSLLFKYSVAALMGFGAAGAASALTVVEEPGSNLAAFSYTVDAAARVITLYETWGVNTSTDVLLKFIDWPHGYTAWRIDKYVTNETGASWTSFRHELLQSDKGSSPDDDGLSFAQLGNPHFPRTSDKFLDLYVDEVAHRDYLDFYNGVVASGETVFFSYGLTNRRETDATEPFYLRQTADAVPEAATWALLIAGFGMVGFALRRRAAIA
ncbi:PEPxxWA-CTERM sorting domain-containing protein [Sandaracinobacter sp. RS1-74]|uniref:PEPxxWA-CTERM sorting domain-containing protein n=1 Tax=Sandaracinobacteroides sayramensis TaxID=2913411 RepID=UPI001EDAB205|nr:PEPxxWA-CTERM sorting domain-containing protein [Sandaracinobacteroides sayramensis]MCG2839810.1 PEPxxWA-CTERM sorting domain-containing protein [Sandaracinobacteroides sayramensis]